MALPVWAVELARYRMPPPPSTASFSVRPPQEACAAGFLDSVVGPEELLATAMSTAARFWRSAPERWRAPRGVLARAGVPRMVDGMDEDLASLSPPE